MRDIDKESGDDCKVSQYRGRARPGGMGWGYSWCMYVATYIHIWMCAYSRYVRTYMHS